MHLINIKKNAYHIYGYRNYVQFIRAECDKVK